MDEPSFHALIRGERRGPWAAALRGGLTLAAGAFRCAAAARAAGYRSGLLPTYRAGVPVLSVGNLTSGGTGKTPLVIELARALAARGERVAVLARGYGAGRDGELNDELRLVRAECPEALLLPGRDRVARARDAVAQGATVVLLDDGFQHRRLARDVDLALIDATDPWGPGGLLPRGLLREPPSALRRAHGVVLTRAEQAAPADLLRLEEQVRRAGFEGPLDRLLLLPGGLRPLDGGPPRPSDALAGAPVLAACGVGNPAAFRRTLEDLGARVLDLRAFPDHHAYGGRDVADLDARARALGAERLVVTGKDAVKLGPLLGDAGREPPWEALDLAVRLDPVGALDRIVSRALDRRAAGAEDPGKGSAP